MANPITNLWFDRAYYDPTSPDPISLTWDVDESLLFSTYCTLQVSTSPDGITWSDWYWQSETAKDYLTLPDCRKGFVAVSHRPKTEGGYIRYRVGSFLAVYDPVEDVTSSQIVYTVSNNCVRRMSNTRVSDWKLDKSSVDAGSDITVDITQTYQIDSVASGTGYTHKVRASLGTQSVSAEMAEFETTATLTLPLYLLNAMPDDIKREATVTVETYREGSLVGSTSQVFTLLCPENVVPSLTVATERLLTVAGKTYPDVTGGYVQNKSAVLVTIPEAAGIFGSYITAYHISVAGRHSSGYNSDEATLSSALLVDAGEVPITCTVTDSRGRKATQTVTITVEPYSPPQATFKAWRVDKDGNPDAQGTYARYEYDYTIAELGGLNTCTASLTVSGVTANNVPKSGDVLPGERMTFPDSMSYSIVLALHDAYGSELCASVLPAYTGTTVTIRPAKPREKRRMIFGQYDTALDGLWTLTSWTLPEPEYQSNYVSVPGRHGLLDLSTVLSDGEPIYGNRILTATFECSEGNRLERNERISEMVNRLDGRRMHIVLPDDQTRYLDGRMSVRTEYSDPAHASVTVTADCDPWRYNVTETSRAFALTSETQQAMLVNKGRRIAVPTVTVLGERATIRCNGYSWELYDGVYTLPDLALPTGKTLLTYSGQGTLVISYREAVL